MNTKEKQFVVEIVRFASLSEQPTVVERMGPFDLRRAEKVCGGAEINLNHREYFTRIVSEATK